MALQNARNQYLKTQIETASKEQLVIMLFDGIIRFTEQARKAIEDNNIEDSHHALMRAQAIVMELICTIDKEKGGDVATNLMSLHAYAFNCLIVCNMKKDVSKIDEVQKIYRELREAWVGAMDNLGISSNATKPVANSDAAPAAAASATKPAAAPQVPPTAGKPLTIPKAPLAASMPKPAAATAPVKPAAGPAANGILAAAAAPASQAAKTPPTLSVAPAAAPAGIPKNAATGYGMGKTAMLGTAKPGAPALRPQPQNPTVVPSTVTAMTPKQAAMLNAYGAGTRSIA